MFTLRADATVPSGLSMRRRMLTTELSGCIRATVPFALLAASTLAAVFQSGPARANPVIEAGVDARIRPGDDFFAYANGSWLAETQIPEGSPRWNARNEINEVTRRQLEKLI